MYETRPLEGDGPDRGITLSGRRRFLIGVAAPAATLAAVVIPFLVTRGELPDPMAVGWDDGGRPRSSSSPNGFLTMQLAIAAACAALFVVAAYLRPLHPMVRAVGAIVAGTMAPTFALASLSTVLINRGATTWTEVEGPGFWWLTAMVVASLAGLVLIGWLGRELYVIPRPPAQPEPTAGLELGASETASWHSGASARWPWLIAVPMVVIGVGLLVTGIVSGQPALSWSGALTLPAGLAALAFTSIQVSGDRRGLTVAYGPMAWPRNRVAPADIDSVATIDVRPMAHGGWGYRGSRRLLGKAAVVLRAGEGIHLDLTNGHRFIVTVDDAETGAGVLNDLRRAAAPALE